MLVHIEPDNVEKCLLCSKTLTNKLTKQAITKNSWQKFADDANRQSEFDVDSSDNLSEFTNVYQQVFKPCKSFYIFFVKKF